ncbi:sensor domain-containing diguanylate cyclase [Enterovibrio nigricans]|uniref:diguanylate cyclase n=1 Tax=Enterovibrio nigricans DSM 22720 TaxID=1121868 RepID=A0A1T4V868_9GAMM|nr:diguanylate cyclase [Enterovibrio nigricans]PKF49093.1 GGDEF domain-containing protein [Enterovibrio nigricans]SKA61072.1 diguanylate cyclase (GGDEF) domain-containing protein [Enterovibrio nigricans DSM 22720]
MLKKLLKSHQSIQTRVSVLVVGVSLLFAIVSVSVQMGLNYTHTVEWTTQSFEKRTASAVSVITYSLERGDSKLLVQQLQDLANARYVSNIHLTTRAGEEFWADNLTKQKETSQHLKYDLVTKGEEIGDLDIYLNLGLIEADALKNALPAGIIYLIEALSVAILLLLVLKRTFTNRIRSLVESVDRIDLSRVSRLTIPNTLTESKDEIGQVARSIQKLHARIRADVIEKKLKERTLKQHKSLLVDEVNARSTELNWQNQSNKLLADLSLRLLQWQKTDVEHDVYLALHQMSTLLETDQFFWLSFDNDTVRYRASYPQQIPLPVVELSDMYKMKRWLLSSQNVALIDAHQLDTHAQAEKELLEHAGIRSIAIFPLTDGSKSFGVIVAANSAKPLAWNDSKNLLFKRFAAMLSELTIRERDHQAMTELQEELILANERLRVEAETDELTRLLNRRPFSRLLSASLYDAVDEHSSLTVMMIDIDHFKAYNDIYGHLQGDKALHYVSRAMSSVSKEWNAPLARFGGEEFALLIRGNDQAQAERIAWQLCQNVRDLCIPHQGSCSSGIITVSIGGVVSYPDGNTSANQLLEMADQCLYKAKRAGRNRAELKFYQVSELSS